MSPAARDSLVGADLFQPLVDGQDGPRSLTAPSASLVDEYLTYKTDGGQALAAVRYDDSAASGSTGLRGRSAVRRLTAGEQYERQRAGKVSAFTVANQFNNS
jgi:hypothetical protein